MGMSIIIFYIKKKKKKKKKRIIFLFYISPGVHMISKLSPPTMWGEGREMGWIEQELQLREEE